MTPPELSGNAPVTDIVRPVEISLFHALRNQLDLSVFYCLCRRLDQFIHFDKPLFLDHRLDRRFASVMRTDIMGIILNADKQSHFIKLLDDRRSCFITIHSLELAAVFIDRGIII